MQQPNAISHDQNFKNLIVDYPREALAFFAPDEAPLPDDKADITPARQEQLQEALGRSFRELDTPLLVNWADGRRSAILFVMEQESDGSRFSPHRLAQYCLDLALMYNGNRRAKYLDFIDIYANLTDNERERYREQYPEENRVMAGIVQTARDEGMRQGRVDGERAVLERQLRRRFGDLSPEVTDRVSEASVADLDVWAEKVLDADTLDDVFNSSQ